MGLWISSIKYKSRNDGVAMKNKMIAGAIVHKSSIICLSSIYQSI
jgi:hypothetical protein